MIVTELPTHNESASTSRLSHPEDIIDNRCVTCLLVRLVASNLVLVRRRPVCAIIITTIRTTIRHIATDTAISTTFESVLLSFARRPIPCHILYLNKSPRIYRYIPNIKQSRAAPHRFSRTLSRIPSLSVNSSQLGSSLPQPRSSRPQLFSLLRRPTYSSCRLALAP